MTNRERLLKTNEYDLLCRVQRYIDYKNRALCVIDAITGHVRYCIDDCEKCIQEWLNEEEIHSCGLRPGITPTEATLDMV